MENNQKPIINKEQFKQTKEIFVSLRNQITTFFHQQKNNSKMPFIIAVIFVTIAVYNGFKLYQNITDLNSNTQSLEVINNYNTTKLRTNTLTRNNIAASSTIYDLIQSNQEIKDEIKRYDKYKENLLYPYTYFLQYLLLPKLNIWKEPYTNEIKTDILGKAFLDENPYNDINLLQKRTDYFSSTSQNEINQIKDIKIGDIQEYENGLFGINIKFSFVAPSKNSLLFLTDKITTTSDQENISLFGEFFYYLRQQIKIDKKEILDQETKTGTFSGENNIDKTIGYLLQNRIFKDEPTQIIDEKVIQNTIINSMGCSTETENECFYRFREKYRNIAELAYTIGLKDNKNKTEDLRKFLKNRAPIMAVKEFTYKKINENSLIKQNTTKFEGSIELEIYGQSISPEERDEIAQDLRKKCFSEKDKKLSPQEALTIIEDNISKKSNTINENENKTNTIRDLKNIIEDINTNFETLNNYKKTIRLFEIYRMLNENGLCKTI